MPEAEEHSHADHTVQAVVTPEARGESLDRGSARAAGCFINEFHVGLDNDGVFDAAVPIAAPLIGRVL